MSSGVYAGIDLGGTKIYVLIAGADGRALGDARAPTPAAEGAEAVVAAMVRCVREAAAEAQIELGAIGAAGVSAPGPIDAGEGVITDPPNLPGWHNVPLARILHDRLGVWTCLENDANCQAVAEHAFGAGRGYRHLLFVTISTGIGGGIIIDDDLYAGASGAAGELGHLILAVDGPVCGAGHRGCLEAFASGTAIAARARELIDAGGLPRTARLAEHNPPLSAETVHRAAEEGELEARAIIERAGHYLGMGLASMINAFNPQAIVLGGGLVNMGELMLGPAVEEARGRSFEQSYTDVRIVEGELGEKAAALGALTVARKKAAVRVR